MGKQLFSFDNKRALIIGGATGMGAAAAQLASSLGAKITVLDVADISYPTERSLKVDLRDKNNVNQVIDSLEGQFDIVFSCAGVAIGTGGLMQINFISQRHIIERMLEKGQIATGGSIVLIASAAGINWQGNLDQVLSFLATPDWEAAEAWLEANQVQADEYSFSKQAINGYVALKGYPLLKDKIRINAVLPGPTDTPLARANADQWLGFGHQYRTDAGVDPLTPEQIANTMAFLASDAASGVNGITLLVDFGHIPASLAGSYNDPVVPYLYGKVPPQ